MIKIAIAKWGGTDDNSWAVFVDDPKKPFLSGLTRREAEDHAGKIIAQVMEADG